MGVSRRRLIGVVALVTSTAGCHVNEPTWTLRVQSAYDEETATGTEIHAEIAFGGQFGKDDVVNNVRVCALDEEDKVMETATIERMSPDNQRTANVTMLADRPPAKLVLGYGSVETDKEFSLKGMKRKEDGVYSSFYQDSPRCSR